MRHGEGRRPQKEPYYKFAKCIVIGASAEGLEPLREVVAQLPVDLPAPVFVAMHLPANHKSSLPEILSNTGPLPAIHPEDITKVEAGFICKENGFRSWIEASGKVCTHPAKRNSLS